MYEIFITEKKYINLEDSSVVVSFQLPSHDWNELSQSPQWKAVENFLSKKGGIAVDDSKLKEILCQHLELLAERSKNCDDKELLIITTAMINTYSVLSSKDFSLL